MFQIIGTFRFLALVRSKVFLRVNVIRLGYLIKMTPLVPDSTEDF